MESRSSVTKRNRLVYLLNMFVSLSVNHLLGMFQSQRNRVLNMLLLKERIRSIIFPLRVTPRFKNSK